MRELTVEQILHNPKYQLIDVRSPSEFEEAHIPGAVNIPLFSDEEREEIGTIYKQTGPDEARWRAMEVVSPKIPALMSAIREFTSQGKEPAIYCWRGGMRSKAVTTFAALVGIPVVRLQGGYRAYRHYILEQTGPHLLPEKIFVLHGMTGVGKTRILQRLEERGLPVLDLENLAGHRGSVFGDIGNRAHNQKTFDALLYHRLYELREQPCLIMEAESKRIGKAVMPDFLLEAKQNGIHLLLEAPVEVRVERIFQEYVKPYKEQPWFKEKVYEALRVIEKKMVADVRNEAFAALDQEDYHHFIQSVLLHYYDPRYAHKLAEYPGPFRKVDVSDMEQGISAIETIIAAEIMPNMSVR